MQAQGHGEILEGLPSRMHLILEGWPTVYGVEPISAGFTTLNVFTARFLFCSLLLIAMSRLIGTPPSVLNTDPRNTPGNSQYLDRPRI